MKKTYCHDGCLMGRKCMGESRADVIEFLGEKYGLRDLEPKSSQELNVILSDHFDVDYKGPDHVHRDEK